MSECREQRSLNGLGPFSAVSVKEDLSSEDCMEGSLLLVGASGLMNGHRAFFIITYI